MCPKLKYVKEMDMQYYTDIIIKPDAEIRLNVLLNRVYTNFHKVLCDLGLTTIGVSFPNYNITLGNILRLHGDEKDLSNLQNLNWIGVEKSCYTVSSVLSIPKESKFRNISRKQVTMSQSKLRRIAKRGTMSEVDIKTYKEKMFAQGLDSPYLELVSYSNGNKYRRYIEIGEILDRPIYGEFDQFGLSKIATVPWF